MEKCPEHPMYYVSEYTLCPECDQFQRKPSAQAIDQHAARSRELNEEIGSLEDSLTLLKEEYKIMSTIALFGWIVAVLAIAMPIISKVFPWLP